MAENDQAVAVKDLKARATAAIDARAEELGLIAKELHDDPEIAFEEVRSSKRLADRLVAAGLTTHLPAFGLETAIASEFGSDNGPTVGIVAEYDALPGLGHACGHNVIGTAALGAALGLADLGESLPGRVRLLGTPAEEGGGGKILMAEEGAFEGLDAVMMIHPADRNLATFPLIARTRITAIFRGQTAHAAAAPEEGVNALDALVSAYVAIGMLRQQVSGDHRIHAVIREGGEAINVIPDRTVGEFAVRAPRRSQLESLLAQVENCLRGSALSAGAEVEIHRDPVEYFDLRGNDALQNAFRNNAEALGRVFDEIETLPSSLTASTDFGNVSYLCPAIHPMIAMVPRGTPFHTHAFAMHAGSSEGTRAVLDGAKAMAMTALDLMCDANLRAMIADDFKADDSQ